MNVEKSNETLWRQYAATFVSEAQQHRLSEEEIDACLQYAKPLMLSGLPVIYDVEHLSELVGYSIFYVMGAITRTANYYRHYSIPKRSGGERKIAEPLPSLKEIQHWILSNILNKISVHPAAKAFCAGKSIKENARFHKSQKTVLTIDIKDFFPSIGAGRVFNVYRSLGYSSQVASALTDLSCLERQLPQGAPSSPALSNIVCLTLDRRLFGFARKNNLRYTRYADDMTFSGNEIGSDEIDFVYKVISKSGFEPNLQKTRVLRLNQRQIVTGVVVNEKLQAPRELRRKLRQQAYYIERFGFEEHAAYQEIDNARYREHLKGQAGFVKSLNKMDRDANALLQILKKES
ncbi:retron St85 family RNA-directed DNA polymerase [Microvirga yunnanensis]|uniref:retron St85 family RNA-directed DNA polymerase n=1 Tax=Microvirga yunnanensis TaxID=2953740 RepID=UPI0021C58825|nr:retron St85 family RNA-directed DNA polymerase [Microvirga sp. HBU65207]